MRQLSLQHGFVVSEFATLAWAASVQRANLYADRTTQDEPLVREFRLAVVQHLTDELLPTYRLRCDEATHLKQIEALVAFGTELGGHLLGEDGYKFAVAQKLLNLQLKYLWCLGFVAEPPHCPIDRLVIEKTRLRGKFNWTEITKREQYLTAIDAVRERAMASNLSIAQWELENYERR